MGGSLKARDAGTERFKQALPVGKPDSGRHGWWPTRQRPIGSRQKDFSHGGEFPSGNAKPYKANRFRRSALLMTEMELKVIAALAMIGLKSKPKAG